MSTASLATCAACEWPIERGQKFVLSGTEVFHKRKECLAGISRSLLVRTRMEVTKQTHRAHHFEAQFKRALEAAEDLNDTTARAVEASEVAVQRLEAEKAARRAAEESATLRKETLNTLQRDRASVVADLEVARRRIRELEAEELARESPPTTSDTADTTDDTATRFSLLELDL